MAVRIASMVLRGAFALAVVLGLFFWTGHEPSGLVPIHMLLGVILVLAVWYLGFAQATSPGGSVGLAAGAGLLGLLVLIVGLNQREWMLGSGHWLIQVLHLLLGIAAVGIGEANASRVQKSAGVAARRR